ncbi:hypothetical protein GmarT_48390 [Gimesia maris]|uniref:Uncharacterized protein n=1 Tax=Gimesia maris TaxID=122 RepID=A0ABX5YT44_9PLAN|nr:hypothetical protein GmarT_48390 [Gimesia maris]
MKLSFVGQLVREILRLNVLGFSPEYDLMKQQIEWTAELRELVSLRFDSDLWI